MPAVLVGVAVALSLVGYALLHPQGISGRHAASGLTPPPISVLPPSAPVTPTYPKYPKRRVTPPKPHPSHQPNPSTARPASTSPSTPSTAPTAPPLVVKYLVASEGSGGFQGEVAVTNNGTQPIANWRIAVVLPDDHVLSFSNASGFVSNGILLLQPGPGAQPIPPRGGRLSVFFVAEGPQTIPQACAFNDVVCG